MQNKIIAGVLSFLFCSLMMAAAKPTGSNGNASKSQSSALFSLGNFLDPAGEWQIAEIPWTEVKARLPQASRESIGVMNADKTRWLVSQPVDEDGDGRPEKLIVQGDFKQNENRTCWIFTGVESWRIPVPPSRTTLQLAPSHLDDIAWENDRIAYRIYSMKHWQASRPGRSGSGIDVWCKHVREPVMTNLYVNGLYKKDRGLGVDAYDVADGRGCGGVGIWAKDKLWTSQCYTSWKEIAAGPLRSEFEVTYGPWDVDGRIISEVRKVSLELGNNFNRMESSFQTQDELAAPLTVAVGLSTHAGAQVEHGAGWIAVWEPADGQGNGMIGTAVLFSKGRFMQTTNQVFLLAEVMAGKPLVYYSGAGWSKGLDFPDKEAWVAYTKSMAAKLPKN